MTIDSIVDNGEGIALGLSEFVIFVARLTTQHQTLQNVILQLQEKALYHM